MRTDLNKISGRNLLEHYQKTIDSCFLVSKTDPKGIITYANKEFSNISKYKLTELLGKPHNIVRHPDMPKSAFKQMWETIQDKQIWKGVVKNKAKDGSTYWVMANIVPIVNQDDEIIEYIAIRTNISETMLLKEREREQAILYRILSITMEDLPLEQILKKCLSEIFQLSWLEQSLKGGILLFEENKNNLKFSASIGISPKLLEDCKEIKTGHCYCGQAALENKITSSNIGEKTKCALYHPNISNHYSIPISIGKTVLGILLVYLPKDYHVKENEIIFLQDIARTIAGAVSRIQTQDLINKKNRILKETQLQIQNQRDKLAKYFSKDLVNGILSDRISTELGGKDARVSILFCDLRASTTIAENMPSEDFYKFLNDLFTDLSDLVYAQGGSINKFLGDGFMATFGVPNKLEDASFSSLKAALNIRDYMKNYNSFRPSSIKQDIKIGLGISRGKVFAGNFGTVNRREYTVIGDPVNIAARLESMTKKAKVDILIDEESRYSLGNKIKVKKLVLGKIRGKQKEIGIFYPIELIQT